MLSTIVKEHQSKQAARREKQGKQQNETTSFVKKTYLIKKS